MQPTFYVWAKWDDEAQVWYTARTSIRGLATEAETLEKLRKRLLLIIPDFLEDEMPPRAVLRLSAQRDEELTPIALNSGKVADRRSNSRPGMKVSVPSKIRSRQLANKILKDAGIGKKF